MGQNARRSGATTDQIEPPFERKWYRAFPDEGIMTGVQPIVDGSKVYIGTLRGIAHAIDSERGHDVWAKKLGGPVLHSCAVAGGRVFVGCADGKLYALDARTGGEVWTCPTGAAIWNAPVALGDLVIFGSRDGGLYACDRAKGRIRWKGTTGGPILCSPAIDAQARRVFVGSEDMHVYAFALADGKPLWTSPKLPGVSFRGYHPVVAPDGSVMITVTPCAGGDAIQQVMHDMVKEIFGDMASWRHKKEENQRLKQQNFRLLDDPRTYDRQMEYLRRRLADEPAYQTFFVLAGDTGRQKFVTPIVYAESMNGSASPPVVTPDDKVIVKYSALLRSRYSQYSPFLNVGYLDTASGRITPIMDQSREYGWYDGLLLVHDEQSQLSVAGKTLFNAHQDNVNAFDLVSLRGSPQPLCHNVHEVQPGVAASLWAMHLDGQSLPMGWEWFARGTAVYGGGSAIDVPIAISGDSFYYLPTHEINAGVTLLAYRMDKNGQAARRAAQPSKKLSADQWKTIQNLRWEWNLLEMPRLNHVLKAGLPEQKAGTRLRPLTEQARQQVGKIGDAELDALILESEDEIVGPTPNRPRRLDPAVQARLERGVQELLSHEWQPLPFPAGKHPVEAYWMFVDPSETLYTLALSYAFLSDSLKTKARQRVATLLSADGPMAVGKQKLYPINRGQVRSAYDPAPLKLLKVQNDLARSPTAQLYPRWLWAVTAGDWAALEKDWPHLSKQIKADREASDFDLGNGRIGGLVAACRIAKKLDDRRTLDAILPKTRQALRDRLEYELAHTEAGLIVQVPHLRTIFGRWRQLTPAVARLLRQYARPIHQHLVDVSADYHRPAWWLAWGPELLWRNETPFSFPTMSSEIYAAKALILEEPADRLASYVDLPWCQADEYYIQKLALLLRSQASATSAAGR